jgi:hypothetical protein
MSELLAKDIKFIEKHYKKSTAGSVISIVNTLIKTAHNNFASLRRTKDMTKVLLQKRLIEAYLLAYPNLQTRKNKMGMIYGLMKLIEKQNGKMQRIFTEEYLKWGENNMNSIARVAETAQMDKMNMHRPNVINQDLTIDEMYAALDYWETNDPYSRQHLILACYTYLLPRRLDWGKAEFVDEFPKNPKEKNYIIITGKKVELLFGDYKTANKIGFWQRKLQNKLFEYRDAILPVHPRFNPEKLRDILIASYKREPRTYLIEKDEIAKPYSQSGFSTLVKAAFRKSIDKHCVATDLRTIITNTIYPQYNPRASLPSKYEKMITSDLGQLHIGTTRGYRTFQMTKKTAKAPAQYEHLKLTETPDVREKVNIPPEIPKAEKRVSLVSIASIVKFANELKDKIEMA